jgi:hypothetical protein
MLLALSLAAAAAPQPIAPATFVQWTAHKGPRRYRALGVTVSIVPVRDRDFTFPRITISARGKKPLTLKGEIGVSAPHQIGIGSLARGQYASVVISGYTGGAHCCDHVIAVQPTATGFRTVDLGQWNGGMPGFPKDLSGDGIADFRFVDNRFLYAFTSYAESFAPPLVMNIRGGKAVDVSAEPAFRFLFADYLPEARRGCVSPAPQGSPNGACAAYAAAAARLGQFLWGWPVVLKSYDRKAKWDWPTGCRGAAPAGQCPQGRQITYPSYPQALRAFLKRTGYLG